MVLAILVAVYVLPALLRGHDVRANMRGADRYSSRLRLLKTDEPRGTRIADAANARRPRLLPEGSRPVMSRSTITAKRRTEAKQALAEVLQHRQVRVRAVNTAASRYRLLLFTAVVTFGSLVYVVARTGVSVWTLLLPVACAALVMWGNLKLRADWRAEDTQLRAEIAEHRQVAGIPPGVTVRVPNRSERETVIAANPGPGPREGAARAVPTPAAGVRAVGGKLAPAGGPRRPTVLVGGPRRPTVPAVTWRPLSEAAKSTEAQGTPAAGVRAGDVAGEQRSVDQRSAEQRDSKRAAGGFARRWWRRAASTDAEAPIVRVPAAERSFSHQVPHVERPGSVTNGTPVAGIAVGGPTPTPAVGLTVGTPVGGISIGTPAAGMTLGTPVAGIPVGGAVSTPAAGLTVGTPVAGVPAAGAAATPAGGVSAVGGDDKSWTPRPVPPPLYTLQPVVHPRTTSPYEEPTLETAATPTRGNQPLDISAHELAEVERALTGHSQLEEVTRRSVEDILERRRDSA